MIFKVAVLQMRSENRAYEENIKTIIKYMTEAKINNADILLVPECFITGYDLTINKDEAISESDLPELCDKANELGVGLVATALTKGNIKPQNSAFVIGKNGEILMKYSKVHTCDFADEKALESGTEFRVCDFDGVKIGIMICYDREYPESARVLMLKGAEIILVPNDCVSMRPRLRALSTRAYENMCGVTMANPNGKNAGNSCAYSPICWDDNDECTDNTLLLADAETEGLFYAAFDMDAIRKYREREMMGNTFRKVKAYSELMSEAIRYPFVREGQKCEKRTGD
ncbi:MAG: carbon-nitrogen hydrolase family protein [Eubacteriales bacterium]|nr:carbon-nitrogen hydrolase family protein [Eubacteriales bacterium]